MQVTPIFQLVQNYAVKAIAVASESPSGLHAELRREVILWLRGRNWPNFSIVRDVWVEMQPIERFCIRTDWAGTTLRACLTQGSRFMGPLWYDIMGGIANGLSQIHQHHVTHGDLSPSNSFSVT
jgi:serine/threonine protein kinase